jgi:hypothetical protein
MTAISTCGAVGLSAAIDRAMVRRCLSTCSNVRKSPVAVRQPFGLAFWWTSSKNTVAVMSVTEIPADELEDERILELTQRPTLSNLDLHWHIRVRRLGPEANIRLFLLHDMRLTLN